MSEPKLSRPRPARRHHGDRGLRAGQERGGGRRQGAQALVERDAARAVAAGDRGLPLGADHLALYPDGSPRGCARRSPAATGSMPAQIVCGNGSDDLLPCWRTPTCGRATKGSTAEHGFLEYPIAIRAAGATAIVAAETDFTADVDAVAGQGHAAHEDGFSRQSEQSDRHLPAVFGGQAAACGPARRRAAGARRRLCRICRAQRLCGRDRTGRDMRQCGDDAHVLEDLRPRQSCASAGPMRRPRSSTRSTASARRSTSTARRSRRASRPWPTRRMSKAAVAHNERWLPWLAEQIAALGVERDAERRQFPAAAFSATGRPHGQGGRRLF